MLSRVARFVWFGIVSLIAGTILLLILQNPQSTRFHFLFWETSELPFSVLLILAFGLGVVVMMLCSVGCKLSKLKTERR